MAPHALYLWFRFPFWCIDAAPPNVPRNVSLTAEHTAENCIKILISWRGPNNLAEAPVSNYTITVKFNGTAVTNASVQSQSKTIEADATIEPDRDFLSSFTVPNCGRYLVTIQATNVYGCESPIDREEITLEEDCGITQDLVCMPRPEADTTNHYNNTVTILSPAVTNNRNAADIPQGIL